MNEPNDERLKRLLRSAIPPVGSAGLDRDLWPRMLQRLDEHATRPSTWEWALVAALVAWFFAFPEAIPGLLYHL